VNIRSVLVRMGEQGFLGPSKRLPAVALMGLVITVAIITSQVRPATGALVFNNSDMSALPATTAQVQACERPSAGGVARSPANLVISSGLPALEFTLRQLSAGYSDPDGNPVMRRCYIYSGPDGNTVAPVIRIKAGDTLTLKVKNELPLDPAMDMPGMPSGNTTNIHYHGLNTSPVAPGDEAIKTMIKPGVIYTYKVKVPNDAPPGLNWFHPHVHMLAQEQVLSGLSGALIVEGMGRAYPKTQLLPEQVFVLRDQEPVRSPDTNSDQSFKDLSINYVPIVTRPSSVPATIVMRPGQAQFWRVANTAADSYMNLQVRYGGVAQNLEVVARDGVVLDQDNGLPKLIPTYAQSILLPPGSRAEFIVPAPRSAVPGEFVALQYNTGIDNGTGDRNLQRTLATIRMNARVDPWSLARVETGQLTTFSPRARFTNLTQITPKRQRTFYFSQCLDDAGLADPWFTLSQLKYFPICKTPGTPEFYITEDGRQPRLYDPNNSDDVVVNKGDVEDWRIVNLDAEAHAFHIHQIHFRVLSSANSQEPGTLRDTINVPGWDGTSTTPPLTNLRMDFRGDIAGTFPYHCHILEHEDKGMMAKIRVNG
jgi:FtsP/CotA-like multicopper oxidase with cupredoxin domain